MNSLYYIAIPGHAVPEQYRSIDIMHILANLSVERMAAGGTVRPIGNLFAAQLCLRHRVL
jgi:hypothetical protein